MNKANIAAPVVFALTLVAGTAMAEDFVACTKDGKTATLSGDVTGSVKGDPSLSEVIRKAWIQTAAQTDGPEIINANEIFAMRVGLALQGRESKDAGMENIAAPVVTGEPGSCTLK